MAPCGHILRFGFVVVLHTGDFLGLHSVNGRWGLNVGGVFDCLSSLIVYHFVICYWFVLDFGGVHSYPLLFW